MCQYEQEELRYDFEVDLGDRLQVLLPLYHCHDQVNVMAVFPRSSTPTS